MKNGIVFLGVWNNEAIEGFFDHLAVLTDKQAIEPIRGYNRDWFPGMNNNSRHVEHRYKDKRSVQGRTATTRRRRANRFRSVS